MTKWILGTLVILINLGAQAEELDFNWKALPGMYNFVSCTNNGHPVWGADTAGTFVHIMVDSSRPNYNILDMYLRRKDGAPLALAWPIDFINHGLQKRRNSDTNKVYSKRETFTDKTGLSNFGHWENEHGTGWRQLRLEFNDNGQLLYRMNLYTSTKKFLADESCLLEPL